MECVQAIETIGGNAGIGGGDHGNVDTIIISGGVVTASGASWAAGIGGGNKGNGGNISISGGTVRAYGFTGGACIGGGFRRTVKKTMKKGEMS